LYLGTLLSHPKALGFRCKQIKISSPYGEEIPIEADGEFLGYSPVSISIVPKAFKLVVP
jgi:diacylglycerol kinase family enzyme